MESHFIEDGYSQPFRINGVPGLHPGLSGTHRPMLPDERDTMYEKALAKKTRVEQNAIYRRVVKGKILDWDAQDAQGKKQPVSEHALRYLFPALWDKLFAVMTGERPSDLSEEAKSPEGEDDDLDRAMKAAAEGQLANSQREADAKN